MSERGIEFGSGPNTTFTADEPIYCFTAVFAPVTLKTTVYHHWYYRRDKSKPFSHADKIPLKIAGGREGGTGPILSSRGSIPATGGWMSKPKTAASSGGWQSGWRIGGSKTAAITHGRLLTGRIEVSMRRISGLTLLE